MIIFVIQCLVGCLSLMKVAPRALHHDCQWPSKNVPIVGLCAKAQHISCKSFPSRPVRLKVTPLFDAQDKTAYVKTSWGPPEFGDNTLWGFEVMLHSKEGDERCFRINRKDSKHRKFTFENVRFGSEYHVQVRSIPVKAENMTNSVSATVQIPDKCNCYKKAKLDLPFSCEQVKEVKLLQSCNSEGKSVIGWKVPNTDHHEIVGDIYSDCSPIKTEFYLKKNDTVKVFENLTMGCEYIVKLFLLRTVNAKWRTSKSNEIKFICKEENPPDTTNDRERSDKKENSDVTNRIALYSALGVLVFGFGIVCIMYRQKLNLIMMKCCEKQTNSKQLSNLLANNNDNAERNEAPSVMLLHSGGCEHLHELVLIFACILNANGLKVRLDLLETLLIDHEGTATYYEKTERESDFVIIFCTDLAAPAIPQTKAFNFILEMIKQNIMDGQDRTKYIPVYFGSQSLVPGTLRCISKKLPEAMLSVLQRLHRIDAYAISRENNIPIRNNVILPEDSFKDFNICVENLSSNSHSLCSSSTCSKGEASTVCSKDFANSFEDLVR